ncbi:hypothetical protein SUGI_1000970 [Cryptomeria japonica]|uniref:cytochrome P450 94B3 n=1 Tax=Cryptomeria japonica TaxID=3369 RepID=UPI002414A18C|nr:cytochrome P450 94B3 [Cryptomeria japonica]GLJ47433.1 hypothetical protein SUGI_1000970 [Cryptomeria japonica]
MTALLLLFFLLVLAAGCSCLFRKDGFRGRLVFVSGCSGLLRKSSFPGRPFHGPRVYPFVGSVFSLWKNRGRLLEWYSEMLVESPTQTIVVGRLGGGRTVVTANPANVEHILRTKFENYPKGEPFTAILHDLLGRGIFNADGDGWKMQRRVASYEFNTRSLRSFIVQVVEEVTDRLLPLLREASETSRCLDLQDVLQRFAFDNICKVAFGVDPACLDGSLPVFKFARAFDVATDLCARRAAAPVSLVWKLKRVLNVGSERRLARAVEVVNEFAMDVIRKRRKEMGCGNGKQDLLSRLMALANRPHLTAIMGAGHLSHEFLRDSIVSFILAGRDTTSAALTWFFWLLCSHPHVEHTIRRETARLVGVRGAGDADASAGQHHDPPVVFTYEQLQQMNYLHASLCEAMRLYPPVPFDSKHALQDDLLPDGTFVTRGDRVTYHPYAMGRMRTIWGPDCLEFKPERWLNENGLYAPRNPFMFAVFQGGVRVCLGKEMAFIQMKYIVASVISNFSLCPVDTHRTPKCISSLTARMVGGFPVFVKTANSNNS